MSIAFTTTDTTRIYRTSTQDTLPSSTSFTLAGWVKLTGGGDTYRILTAGTATETKRMNIHCAATYTNAATLVTNISTQDTFATGFADQWIYLSIACSGTGAGSLTAHWWNSSGVLQDSLSGTGVDFTVAPNADVMTRIGFGDVWGSTNNILGKIAYGRIWSAALSSTDLQKEVMSTTPHEDNAGSIYSAFGADSLTDVSGNNRDWSGDNVTTESGDNPQLTVKKLKLLAHSSAASQSSIEGVVLNAARDTVIGEFSAQSFDASLVGTEAQLLITATDISPNGSTLTTSDHPLAIAYNATYTTGLVTCDVVEV